MRNSSWIFYEKGFFTYKKIVLSKVELTFERKCEYLWDFSIAQAGTLTIETTCPKLWFFKILLAPGKRATTGVKPCALKLMEALLGMVAKKMVNN